MKKIASVFVFASVYFLVSALDANAEEMCVDSQQSAISPRGSCQIFPTSCDVPDDWKKVDSCEKIKNPKFGLRPDRKFKSRISARVKKWREQKKNKIREKYRRHRKSAVDVGAIGSGSLTRDFRSRTRRLPTKFRNPKFKTREFVSKKIHRKKKIKKSDKRRVGRPPLASRATGARRTGKFSAQPRWSVEQKTHAKRVPGKRFWKGYHAQSRKSRRRRNQKLQEVKLKKFWRGSPLEGSLEQ